MEIELKVNFCELEFQFVTNPSLFSPAQLDAGSKILLETVKIPESAKNIMDLGCGWGGIGIILAKLHPDKFFYLVDNDPVAIKLAKKNVELNGVKNVKVFKADVTYSTLPSSFDVIVTNPPWDKNRSVIPALVKFAYDHLNTNGQFYVVINQSFRTEDEMEKIFGLVEKIAEKPPYKILHSIKSSLKRNDLLEWTKNILVTKQLKLDPLKSQYFLTDTQTIQKLIAAAHLKSEDTVLEIGAGMGSITKQLIKSPADILAIEIDKQFGFAFGKPNPKFKLLFEDFFEMFKSKTDAPTFTKIIANLPFTTSGPILLKLKNYSFETAILILPERFATRLVDGEMKEYFRVEKLFEIPRAFFFPMPANDSVAVKLTKVK